MLTPWGRTSSGGWRSGKTKSTNSTKRPSKSPWKTNTIWKVSAYALTNFIWAPNYLIVLKHTLLGWSGKDQLNMNSYFVKIHILFSVIKVVLCFTMKIWSLVHWSEGNYRLRTWEQSLPSSDFRSPVSFWVVPPSNLGVPWSSHPDQAALWCLLECRHIELESSWCTFERLALCRSLLTESNAQRTSLIFHVSKIDARCIQLQSSQLCHAIWRKSVQL